VFLIGIGAREYTPEQTREPIVADIAKTGTFHRDRQ